MDTTNNCEPILAGMIQKKGDVRIHRKSFPYTVEAIPESDYGKPVPEREDTEFYYFRPHENLP